MAAIIKPSKERVQAACDVIADKGMKYLCSGEFSRVEILAALLICVFTTLELAKIDRADFAFNFELGEKALYAMAHLPEGKLENV